MIPAYIKLKRNGTCHVCRETINGGTLAFYSAGQVWHYRCGLPDWKTPGTPYDIRKQKRIFHQKWDDLNVGDQEVADVLGKATFYTQEDLQKMTSVTMDQLPQIMSVLLKMCARGGDEESKDYVQQIYRLVGGK